MNAKLNQLFSYINTIDYRHLQIVYSAVVMIAMFIAQKPSDGGIGPS